MSNSNPYLAELSNLHQTIQSHLSRLKKESDSQQHRHLRNQIMADLERLEVVSILSEVRQTINIRTEQLAFERKLEASLKAISDSTDRGAV